MVPLHPKVAEAFNVIPALLGSTLGHPSGHSSFLKGQIDWLGHPVTSSNGSYCDCDKIFSLGKKTV